MAAMARDITQMHVRPPIPTLKAQAKDGGKDGGKGWGGGNKGGWGKGFGGKGKGKGKGNKGGLYELDLMNQWGDSWDQGYDQNWSQWGDDGSGGGYLRSLGCIDTCAPQHLAHEG